MIFSHYYSETTGRQIAHLHIGKTGRIISQAEGQSAMDAHGESLEVPKHKDALVVSQGKKVASRVPANY